MFFFTQKFVLVSSFLFSAVICFAQKETLLSGTIYGLDAGSKISLSQTARAERIDSILVTSDSFQFKITIKQGDIYFLGFTVNSQPFGQPVYLQNGSDIHINITKNYERTTFTGSSLANEQNDYIRGLYPIYDGGFLIDKNY